MVWTMLLSICFLAAIAGGVNSAEASQANWIGYVGAVLIGSLVGGICVRTLTTVATKVETFAGRFSSEGVRERFLGALYASTVLWMFLGATLSDWLNSALTRLVR